MTADAQFAANSDDPLIGPPDEPRQAPGAYSLSDMLKRSRKLVAESKRILAESRRNDPPTRP